MTLPQSASRPALPCDLCLGGILGFPLHSHGPSGLCDISSLPRGCGAEKEGEASPALWTSH